MSKAVPSAHDILQEIEPRFETSDQAKIWFETEVLSGFSGTTAQQLVEAGRGHEVLAYVAAVDAGIYA